MPLPRTPPIMYLHPVPPQPSRFNEGEHRNSDNNTPVNNRPTTQLNEDNRSVHSGRQDAEYDSGDGGQNKWRQPEAENLYNRQPEPELQNGNRQELNVSDDDQVRKGINYIDDKTDRLDKSVEKFESDWQDVPGRVEGVESVMAASNPKFKELQQTRMSQSARIHALEDEVKNVKLQNDALKEEMVRRGEVDERMIGNGYDNMDCRQRQLSNQYPAAPHEQSQGNYGQGQGQGQRSYDAGYRDGVGQQQAGHGQQNQGGGRRMHENKRHRISLGSVDPDRYLGFNQFYNPDLATSYRREQATIEYAKYGKLSQEEEWNQKRRDEEEMFLKEKPRTYAYTEPYHSFLPPPDVNKFFHDSKYLQERPPTVSDIYTRESVPFRANPGTGMSTYEVSYLTPRGDKQAQEPGGLYVIRFHNSGYDDVRLALREQQTVMHSHKGHILGIAKSHNVAILEGEADWTPARKQNHRAQLSVPHRCSEDAVAMLWFPSHNRAFDFCNTSFKNRFRQYDFPTPQSAEIYYIPMVSPLYHRELDTFLFMELCNAKRYPPENLQRFEEEARQRMLEFNPNCIPFVVTCVLQGKEALKTGGRAQLLRQGSKLFVSRFSDLADVAALWQSGIIQRTRDDWSLNGPVNAYVIALKDFRD